MFRENAEPRKQGYEVPTEELHRFPCEVRIPIKNRKVSLSLPPDTSQSTYIVRDDEIQWKKMERRLTVQPIINKC